MKGEEQKKQGIESFISTNREELFDFVPAEITLETAGFFSPSSRRLKTKIKEKHYKSKTADGELLSTTLQIIPSVKHGLPITSDFDYYRAFQKILNDYRNLGGDLDSYIQVSTKKLISYAGKQKSANEVKAVQAFFFRLANTAIVGEVYDHKNKRFKKINTSPFAEVVQIGEELPDGSIAQTNFVWLAPFYKRNLLNGALRSVDHAFHFRLGKPIAKALYPLLETGWYASGNTLWRKRYQSLCDELLLTQRTTLSEIKRQVEPSIQELQNQGFLASWEIQKSSTSQDFVLSFRPGPYYFEVQAALEERRQKAKQIAQSEQAKLTEIQEDLLYRILDICGDKHSERYYKLLIKREPRALIEMALSETKDLKLRGQIKTTPGQMFVGILKDIKEKRAR